MHRYRIKTTRALPDTGISARVTQPQHNLPARVSECRVWRDEPMYAGGKVYICTDLLDDYGESSVLVDLTRADEPIAVEIDLHDPVTALQILLRFRDVFGPGAMFYEEQAVLLDLLHESPAAVTSRTTALNALLARLDAVSDEKEASDADPS